MGQLITISKIDCIGRTHLAVTWLDGKLSCVDLAGWIATGGKSLSHLKDPHYFAAVRISEGGTGLAWDDRAIDAMRLWRIASEQCAFSRADLAAWQAEIALSNQEAAEFLGISLSAWNTYKAGINPIPAPVAMVCRAALRDPVLREARYKPRMRGRPRNEPALSLLR